MRWIEYTLVTAAESVEALNRVLADPNAQRCLRGASGRGTLEDIACCYAPDPESPSSYGDDDEPAPESTEGTTTSAATPSPAPGHVVITEIEYQTLLDKIARGVTAERELRQLEREQALDALDADDLYKLFADATGVTR